MPTPLKVLIVSASEEDALVISLELKRGGFGVDYHRVDNETAMIYALQSRTWDLVIAAYCLPGFSSLDALKVVKWHGVDLPFVVVSGEGGEEMAVEAIKAGADNYILKNKLVQLVPAVRDALGEAKSRQEQGRVEKALEDSEEKYRLILAEEELSRAFFAQTEQAVIVCDVKGIIIRASEVAKTICGGNPILKPFEDTFPLCLGGGEVAGGFSLARVLAGEVLRGLEFTYTKPGEPRNLLLNAGPLTSKGARIIGCMVTLTDITERKRAEESLRRSQENYRRLSKTANEGIWILNAENNTTYANPKIAEMLGFTSEEMVGMPLSHFMKAEDRIQAEVNLARGRKGMSRQYEVKLFRKDGSDLWASLSTSPILDGDGHYEGVLALVTDITARIRAEEVSRELLEELRLANEELQAQNEKLEMQKKESLRLMQALEMKQTFLETVLRHLPAGVVIVGAPSGKLVMRNDKVESIFGPVPTTDANIADYDRHQFFHRDGTPYSSEEWPLMRSLVAGESVNNEEMVFYDNNSKKLLAVNSAPIRNRDGAIVAAVAVFSEISSTQSLEKRLRHL